MALNLVSMKWIQKYVENLQLMITAKILAKIVHIAIYRDFGKLQKNQMLNKQKSRSQFRKNVISLIQMVSVKN